jgi:hypothetical protein
VEGTSSTEPERSSREEVAATADEEAGCADFVDCREPEASPIAPSPTVPKLASSSVLGRQFCLRNTGGTLTYGLSGWMTPESLQIAVRCAVGIWAFPIGTLDEEEGERNAGGSFIYGLGV